jgi:hypothetical protein
MSQEAVTLDVQLHLPGDLVQRVAVDGCRPPCCNAQKVHQRRSGVLFVQTPVLSYTVTDDPSRFGNQR